MSPLAYARPSSGAPLPPSETKDTMCWFFMGSYLGFIVTAGLFAVLVRDAPAVGIIILLPAIALVPATVTLVLFWLGALIHSAAFRRPLFECSTRFTFLA